MPPRRPVDAAAGRAALAAWCRDPEGSDRARLALAVRWSLAELAARHPGPTCEVRVPPFAVVQCLPGPRHTRGTPPNVIETDPATWLALATGGLGWSEAVDAGRVRAGGGRADLADCLPVVTPEELAAVERR